MPPRLLDSLPGHVERVASYLTEAGHGEMSSVAMAFSLTGDEPSGRLRHSLRSYRDLRMTAGERAEYAGVLLARRVIVEGYATALAGDDIREGTVLSAHKLCESRAVRRPMTMTIGGGVARLEQVQAARARLDAELTELDRIIEAAVADEDPNNDLSIADRGAKANVRVVHLQNRLNSLGHRVQADGIFGPITDEAVKDFQTKADLDPTGVVDANTTQALRRGGKVTVNAAPGLIPGQAQTPPTGDPKVDNETGNKVDQDEPLQPNRAQSAGEKDEGANDAKPSSSSTSSSSDPKKKTATSKKGRRISVHLDLGESTVDRLTTKWLTAAEERESAIAAGEGTAVRIAEARWKVFDRQLAEAVLEETILQEADSPADFPQAQMPSKTEKLPTACPKCRAPMRNQFVCQRGHRIVKSAKLQETWSDAARAAAAATRHEHAMEKAHVPGASKRIIDSVHGKTGDPATAAINTGEGIDTQKLHTDADGKYSPEREALHKQIIQHFMRGSKSHDHPKAIFTAGGAASGKSALAGQAKNDADNIPVPADHVYINPDDIKQMLPEYGELQKAGHGELSAASTHEESSDIAKQLTAIAMQRNRNMVIDGTGNSKVGKFGAKLQAAKAAGYDVDARYAHIPVQEAKDRETKRAIRSGRKVDHTVLEAQHKTVAQSYVQDVRQMKGVHVHIYSTAERGQPRLIASHDTTGKLTVHDPAAYREMTDKANA